MQEVLVDARVVEQGHTGMARYVRELVRVLGERPGWRLSAIQGLKAAALPGVSEVVRARLPFLHPGEQAEIPFLVTKWRGFRRRGAPFWVPAFNAPVLAPGPLVLTVHDANHLAFPEHYGPEHTAYYKTFVKVGCARAAAVLVPSSFARREVMARIGVSAAKVHVTPLGVVVPPRPDDARIAEVRAARQLPSKYVVCVGNFKAHKNVPLLLEAAVLFKDLAGLVLVGGAEEELGNALPAARSAGAEVHVLRQVPDDELWAVMAGASVFAFPSRYEGFGLPPVEAMALGVPVVASDAASIPEVTGGAAWLSSPDDPLRFAEAIRALLSDPVAAAEWVAKGRARVKELTWDACADKTAAVLESVSG